MTLGSPWISLGRAGGDGDAEVERHHPVGEVHHHVHVVLDEDHRQVELVAHLEDVAGHVLGLLEVHAGDWLVEQQQPWLHGQCPAQLDALLQAVGEQTHDAVAVGGQLEQVDHLLHRGAVLELLPLGPPEPQRSGEEPGAHEVVATEQEVVDHVEVGEQTEVLEGAPDAEAGRAAGLLADEVDTVEADRALLGPVHRRETVEDRRLARTVGPDHCEQLAWEHVEAHVAQGGHPAEAQREVANLQQRLTRGRVIHVQIRRQQIGHQVPHAFLRR